MHSARIVVTMGVLALGLAAFSGTASAHPRGHPLSLTCESVAYDVSTVSGSQYWSPVQDAASNDIFHPVFFGDIRVTILDPGGVVVDEFTEPDGSTRGRGTGRNDIVECTYTFTNFDSDGFSYVVDGDVSGYWSPRR
jgi:hypothetical protein